MLERQGLQLDRMQDQLEKALREIAALRRQLKKPPPEGPSPASPTPSPAGDGPAPASPGLPAPPRSPTKPPRKKRESFGRNKPPVGLERVEDPTATELCPRCGGVDLVVLRHDSHEAYDYLPARLVVRVVNRPVCHCATCDGLVQPPLPVDLIPKLLATPGLLGHIIYEKFGRHLPLNRIASNCVDSVARFVTSPVTAGSSGRHVTSICRSPPRRPSSSSSTSSIPMVPASP